MWDSPEFSKGPGAVQVGNQWISIEWKLITLPPGQGAFPSDLGHTQVLTVSLHLGTFYGHLDTGPCFLLTPVFRVRL